VKKLVLVLIIAIVPLMAFADFQIGVTGLYDVPLSYIDNSTSVGPNDLSYGLETRVKLWMFQGGLSALYNGSGDIIAITDLGVAFDVLFFRLGLGVGPVIGYNMDSQASTNTGYWTMKSTLDLNLGNLGLGLIAYTFMPSGLSDLSYVLSNYMDYTEVGVTLMFRLF
jgi:hypothetical protein